jgi:hypothetical protein
MKRLLRQVPMTVVAIKQARRGNAVNLLLLCWLISKDEKTTMLSLNTKKIREPVGCVESTLPRSTGDSFSVQTWLCRN